MVEKKLFSRHWIYENLFGLSENEYLREQNRIIQDTKEQFRIEQIKTEGNDPVKTGESFGTPHDIATLYKGSGGVPKGYDERNSEMPPGGWPGAGRPEEPGTHGTHEHPLGWDPLGNKTIRKVYEGSGKTKMLAENIKKEMTTKKSAIEETFKVDTLEESSNLLDESNILPEE